MVGLKLDVVDIFENQSKVIFTKSIKIVVSVSSALKVEIFSQNGYPKST